MCYMCEIFSQNEFLARADDYTKLLTESGSGVMMKWQLMTIKLVRLEGVNFHRSDITKSCEK